MTVTIATWSLEQHRHRSESDDDIYEPFYHRPAPEDEIDEIEIDADIATESYESPVRCSYPEEEVCSRVDYTVSPTNMIVHHM